MSLGRMVGLVNSPLGKPEVIFRLEVGGNVTEIYYGFRRQELIGYQDNQTQNNGTYVEDPYDYGGAMYFAVAVILIYGISIAFLIGTTLRKSQQDDEVKGFLRSYANLDDRVYAKQRVRKALKEKNLLTLVTETTRVAAAAGGAGMVMGINPQPRHVRRSPRGSLQGSEVANVGQSAAYQGQGEREAVGSMSGEVVQSRARRDICESIDEEDPVYRHTEGAKITGPKMARGTKEGVPSTLYINWRSKEWRRQDASADGSSMQRVKGKYPGTVILDPGNRIFLERHSDCPLTEEKDILERFKPERCCSGPDQSNKIMKYFHLEKFLMSHNDSNTSIADSGVCSATIAEEGSLSDDMQCKVISKERKSFVKEDPLEPNWDAWNPPSVGEQTHTLDIQVRGVVHQESKSLDGAPATATLDFQAPCIMNPPTLDVTPMSLGFQVSHGRYPTLDSKSLDEPHITLDHPVYEREIHTSSSCNFPRRETVAFPSRDNSCIFVSLEDESEYMENKVSMEELTLMEKDSMTLNL